MGTIQSVKASIGWVAPNKRPACRNCTRVDERGNPLAPSWYCKEAEFLTSAYAICGKHQWKDAAK